MRALLSEAKQQEGETKQLSFFGLLHESSSRLEIIVTFLAVLELVKQREVVAQQDATFGEIMLIVVESSAESPPEPSDGEIDELAAAT